MIVPFRIHLILRIACSLLLISVQPSLAPAVQQNPTTDQLHFFESKIRPLLIDRCIDCHQRDDPQNNLILESRQAMLRGGDFGPAIVPGKPKESLLISAINHDEFLKMPPKEKLSTADVVNLTKWVEMGAPWTPSKGQADPRQPASVEKKKKQSYVISQTQKNHWAFQPVTKPQLPRVKNVAWPRSEIDLFILQQLEKQGLDPAAEIARATWIRRATFDLTGLPPTYPQIRDFVADKSAHAYEKVIDRLLSSPRYGEKWGRHWLDVARFADSNGLDENLSYANAFRYRDYVIRSFNLDKPFDRFAREQIAGDLLGDAKGTPKNTGEFDPHIATGFLAIGPKMLAEDDPMKMQMDIIDEQLSTLGQAFMAMTIGCSRCHDHKFDPIPTDDYYSLAGIFKSTKTMENHNVVAVWYERPLLSQELQEKIKRHESNIAATQSQLNQLVEKVKTGIKQDIFNHLDKILVESTTYEKFDQASTGALKTGFKASPNPFPVKQGYALIEAEAFHRGNLVRDHTTYGTGIGVAISGGAAFGEFDLDVEHAGKYAVEFRYAAQDSRPFNLILNGKTVSKSIGGQTTGTWMPDSQQWFLETEIELPAGKNVLKLDSAKVYPHIDKIALVYKSAGAWPFGKPPYSMFVINRQLNHGKRTADYSIQFVELFDSFLTNLEHGKIKDQSLFASWNTLSKFEKYFSTWFDGQDAERPIEYQKLLQFWLHTDSARNIDASLMGILRKTQPKNLHEMAIAFKSLVQELKNKTAVTQTSKELVRQLQSADNPLNGPSKNIDSFLDEPQNRRHTELKSRIDSLKQSKPKPGVAMGVTEAKPENLKVHQRGSHLILGKTVPRRFLKIINGDQRVEIGDDRSGRLEFANWMTRPNHPLTSRVIINRVWHWHFGQGIVPTVDNFGLLGEHPSHPKLLDWLASRFMEEGWSLKRLHREIMLSQTYRMSATGNTAATKIDPENQWLWRFRRRRLTAEETRDAVISVSTGIDTQMYGTLLKAENRKYVTNSSTSITDEYSNRRRSVYLPVVRSSVYDVFQTLDFPDPAVSTGSRQTSTIAPQALMMMNSQLVHASTRAIAEELADIDQDDRQKITTAYKRILNRRPNASELARLISFVDRNTATFQENKPAGNDKGLSPEEKTLLWQSVCRILISTNEFSFIE